MGSQNRLGYKFIFKVILCLSQLKFYDLEILLRNEKSKPMTDSEGCRPGEVGIQTRGRCDRPGKGPADNVAAP